MSPKSSLRFSTTALPSTYSPRLPRSFRFPLQLRLRDHSPMFRTLDIRSALYHRIRPRCPTRSTLQVFSPSPLTKLPRRLYHRTTYSGCDSYHSSSTPVHLSLEVPFCPKKCSGALWLTLITSTSFDSLRSIDGYTTLSKSQIGCPKRTRLPWC